MIRSEEYRRHPLRAVTRRVAWRVRWRLGRAETVLLDPWIDDLRIALPRTGSAAPLYYRRGHSDPDLASAIDAALEPGGTYVDVGAHVGEFVLIGARRAGAFGRVYALEPNPTLAQAIRRNVALNAFENVTVVQAALGGETASIGFAHDERSFGGWLIPDGDGAYSVEMLKLDDFADANDIAVIDVMKLDAAGFESEALRGAGTLLASRRITTILAKLYDAKTVLGRSGGDHLDLVRTLWDAGYEVRLAQGGHRLLVRDVAELAFESTAYSRLLIATSPAP